MIIEFLSIIVVAYLFLVSLNIVLKIAWHWIANSKDQYDDLDPLPSHLEEVDKAFETFFIMDMHPLNILKLQGTIEHLEMLIVHLLKSIRLNYFSGSIEYRTIIGAYIATKEMHLRKEIGDNLAKPAIENYEREIKEYRNKYTRTAKLIEKIFEPDYTFDNL